MPAKEVTFDAEMEQVYQEYLHRPGNDESVAEMIQEPKVALRYWHSWGVPNSKETHRQRAEYFGRLHAEYEDTYRDLVAYALEEYGDRGPLISGVVQEHFPAHVKNRLRFLSRAKNLTSDARRLHEFLSKTRNPAFT